MKGDEKEMKTWCRRIGCRKEIPWEDWFCEEHEREFYEFIEKNPVFIPRDLTETSDHWKRVKFIRSGRGSKQDRFMEIVKLRQFLMSYDLDMLISELTTLETLREEVETVYNRIIENERKRESDPNDEVADWNL
jgi:hypothetical protein